jgi:hypothetical protein
MLRKRAAKPFHSIRPSCPGHLLQQASSPLPKRPQAGRNRAQYLGGEETLAEEKESNDKKPHSMAVNGR